MHLSGFVYVFESRPHGGAAKKQDQQRQCGEFGCDSSPSVEVYDWIELFFLKVRFPFSACTGSCVFLSGNLLIVNQPL